MDKLKPILAQKFWILSGLCLLMPLTGWWMATAAMSNEYNTRVETLKKAFSGIPQPGPNKNWTDRVLALNVEEERKVKQTGEFLWNQQLSLMTWPEKVAAEVEKAGFTGEIPARTRGEYRYAYELELVDLHQIPSPFDPTTGTGIVDFPIELIPTMSWGSSPIPPSSQQMRESQEDIWMFRTLLQGVKNLNEQFGCKNMVDSKVKQILFMELRGGTPGGAAAAAEALAAAAGAMGGEGMGGGAGMPGMGLPGGAGPGGMNSVMGAGGSDGLNASFDPAEQFGSDDAPVVAAEGGDPAAMGGAGAMPGGPGMAAGMPGGPGMGMGGGATVKKRYIEETPRFKTRGFYMEVVLDHRVLPEFIAELSDSKWPLRVIRVQSVDLDTADIGSSTVGSMGGGPGMGGMGLPGGAAAGRGAMRSPSPSPRAGSGMAGSAMPNAGGMGLGRTSRPTGGAGRGIGEIGGNFGGGESTLELQNAMTDPYLVKVALSGIITIYLPPEVPAAGTEGAPGSTPAATDAVVTETAPATESTDTAASIDAAADAAAAADGAPESTTAPTTSSTTGTSPTDAAATTTPAADAAATPGDAKPAEGAPPADDATPAPTTPAPAKPDAPAAADGTPPANK